MDTLREKYTELEEQVVAKISELLEKKGANSASQSTKVLVVIDEEMMWNLEGGRYLVELNETSLIDNRGYTYSLDTLNLERLCETVDSIAESCYDFRVGTMDSNGTMELYKYFNDKEKAYEHFIEVRAKIIGGEHSSSDVWTEERVGDEYETGDSYNIEEDELEEN